MTKHQNHNSRSPVKGGYGTVHCTSVSHLSDLVQRQLEQLPQIQLLTRASFAEADILVLDATQPAATPGASAITMAELEDACTSNAASHLPLLLIIDNTIAPDALTDFLNNVNPSRIEIISVLELHGCLPLIRINLLLQRHRTIEEPDVLRDNAETILMAVMEYSNDWMVLKDLEHRFLLVSKNFCRSFGKSTEEILGKNDIQIGTSPELVLGKPDTDWKGYWELDRQVTNKGVPVVLQPLILDDDALSEKRESTDKVPLKDKHGNVFALLVVVSELNQSLKSKERTKLRGSRTWERKSNLEHSPALLVLNQERIRMEELQVESENAFIAKNRFIASASHDLRQPLHALGLYLSALEERIEEDSRFLVDKLRNCVVSLNELLGSLLDISRLDANVISAEFSSFPIAELLDSLNEECLSLAARKGLELNYNCDSSIAYSDPILLRRVLRNLIVNAINYTIEGKVSVRARASGNLLELVVSDTGVGLSEEQQKTVFDEFTKFEKGGVQVGQGLGLGLSIVKRLCILLKIGSSLESQLNKGTSFTLTIPLGSRKEVEAEIAPAGTQNTLTDQQSPNTNPATVHSTKAQSQQQTSSLIGRIILVIDDDLEVIDAVTIMLLQHQCTVISATNVEEALSNMAQVQKVPDLILVDFRLSENATGIDAIKRIERELLLSIPALIVTGDTSEKGLQKITLSGYGHVHKPMDATTLLSKMALLLETTL